MRSSHAGYPRRDAVSDWCASSSRHRPGQLLCRNAARDGRPGSRSLKGSVVRAVISGIAAISRQPGAIRAQFGRSPKRRAHVSDTCGWDLTTRLKPHAPCPGPNRRSCKAVVDQAHGDERIGCASHTGLSPALQVFIDRSRRATRERRLFRWPHLVLPRRPMSKRTVQCGSRCAWHRAPRAPSHWVPALPGWQQ